MSRHSKTRHGIQTNRNGEIQPSFGVILRSEGEWNMFDFDTYAQKCADSGRGLIRRAYDEACARDHNQLTPDHVFVAIAEIDRSFFNEVMQSLNLDPQVVVQALETKLNRGYFGRSVKTLSESLRTLLSNALKHARERGRSRIESTDLFLALFVDPHSYAVKLFKRLGADPRMVTQKIQALAHSQ